MQHATFSPPHFPLVLGAFQKVHFYCTMRSRDDLSACGCLPSTAIIQFFNKNSAFLCWPLHRIIEAIISHTRTKLFYLSYMIRLRRNSIRSLIFIYLLVLPNLRPQRLTTKKKQRLRCTARREILNHISVNLDFMISVNLILNFKLVFCSNVASNHFL